ncbi:hypothetical protein NE645_17520, partial [Roseburia hominis]|nr:hypothetical protein [Roseburia hominis]
ESFFTPNPLRMILLYRMPIPIPIPIPIPKVATQINNQVLHITVYLYFAEMPLDTLYLPIVCRKLITFLTLRKNLEKRASVIASVR